MSVRLADLTDADVAAERKRFPLVFAATQSVNAPNSGWVGAAERR